MGFDEEQNMLIYGMLGKAKVGAISLIHYKKIKDQRWKNLYLIK